MGRPSGKHLDENQRDSAMRRIADAVAADEVLTEVAAELGVTKGTVYEYAKKVRAQQLRNETVTFPTFVAEGDEEKPIDQLIRERVQSYERRRKAADARKWFALSVHETKPYGLLWFGDPHLDDNGCNWPLLESHLKVARQPGVYGGNVGDSVNNWPWTGRLARLWAEAEVSDREAKRLAEWFMFESGVKWWLWLLGNHDEWNGGADFYRRLGAHFVPVIDWRAQFVLKHDNGIENRIDASHGRKGSSIYNPSHGTLRAARFGESADLYVTGHIHSFKLDHFEDAERQQVSWLAQVRGYKEMDHHALTNGFAAYSLGASILSVHDPETGAIVCFADPEEGAEYLRFKRR